MPLRRSPPLPTANVITGGATHDHQNITAPKVMPAYDSDTPSEQSGSGVNLNRFKRRREQDDEIKDLRKEMRDLFADLSSTVSKKFDDVIKQNSELQCSVQFLSDKYDSLLVKLQSLENEKSNDKRQISMLEDKVEMLEKKLKSTGIEIRNLPQRDVKIPESKTSMANSVKILAAVINIDLNDYEIKDTYRINSSKEKIKPLVVEFVSTMKREIFLQAVKNFNRTKQKGEKLNSMHLQFPGPVLPVYVAETLTHKTQKLFFQTREYARNNGYAYSWVSKGSVYIRKGDGQPQSRIESEADLAKLKKTM